MTGIRSSYTENDSSMIKKMTTDPEDEGYTRNASEDPNDAQSNSMPETYEQQTEVDRAASDGMMQHELKRTPPPTIDQTGTDGCD